MDTPNPEAEAVIVKRTFEAPREKVFQAWTDPELMTKVGTAASIPLSGHSGARSFNPHRLN